jgi:hypothetical protein
MLSVNRVQDVKRANFEPLFHKANDRRWPTIAIGSCGRLADS